MSEHFKIAILKPIFQKLLFENKPTITYLLSSSFENFNFFFSHVDQRAANMNSVLEMLKKQARDENDDSDGGWESADDDDEKKDPQPEDEHELKENVTRFETVGGTKSRRSLESYNQYPCKL